MGLFGQLLITFNVDALSLVAERRPEFGFFGIVFFVVGVNGGGKTTTVGKLAAQEKQDGRTPIVVAADTFRAAAIDQLQRWAERAGVSVTVRHSPGGDIEAACGQLALRRVDS